MTTNLKLKQLKLLLNDFELLSKTALTQLQITNKLFEDNTLDMLYEEAEENEIIMDRLEVKVREEIVFTILQFNPIASDLRKIVTYQDVTTNLERIGDMLLNIIHFLKKIDLNNPLYADMKKHMIKMLGYVQAMLRNAIYAFQNEDAKLAYQTIAEDDKVDKLFHQTHNDLATLFANKSISKEDIGEVIILTSIAHNFERIGDSATNIAEAAVYLTEGKDIRHGNEK